MSDRSRLLILNFAPRSTGIANWALLLNNHWPGPVDWVNVRPIPRYRNFEFPMPDNLVLPPICNSDSGLISAFSIGLGVFGRAVADKLRSLSRTYDLALLDSPEGAFLSNHLKNDFIRTTAVAVNDVGALWSWPDLYVRFLRWNIRKLQLAERVISISNSTTDDILRMNPAVRGRVRTIPLTVDPERFRHRDQKAARAALRLPADSTLILSIGRDVPAKNLSTLFRAFDLIPDKSVSLVRVGPITLSVSAYRELQPRTRDRIILRSNVADEEIPLYYNATDYVVFPSVSEGLGLEVLEAAFSEKPCIVLDKPPMNLVAPSSSLLVASPYSSKEWARAMATMIEDTGFRRRLSLETRVAMEGNPLRTFVDRFTELV
jgi:glycosyltransferase involved in cell wall biosynthesis